MTTVFINWERYLFFVSRPILILNWRQVSKSFYLNKLYLTTSFIFIVTFIVGYLILIKSSFREDVQVTASEMASAIFFLISYNQKFIEHLNINIPLKTLKRYHIWCISLESVKIQMKLIVKYSFLKYGERDKVMLLKHVSNHVLTDIMIRMVVE